jgi:hypothetical protein
VRWLNFHTTWFNPFTTLLSKPLGTRIVVVTTRIAATTSTVCTTSSSLRLPERVRHEERYSTTTKNGAEWCSVATLIAQDVSIGVSFLEATYRAARSMYVHLSLSFNKVAKPISSILFAVLARELVPHTRTIDSHERSPMPPVLHPTTRITFTLISGCWSPVLILRLTVLKC